MLFEGNRDKETVGINGSSKPFRVRPPNDRIPRGIVGTSSSRFDKMSGARATVTWIEKQQRLHVSLLTQGGEKPSKGELLREDGTMW
jgi:hypothetical protein